MSTRPFTVRRLGSGDLPQLRQLNAAFAEAFADPASYLSHPPGDAYLAELLARPGVIALAATIDGKVIGGLVAYELDKLEMARREIYIYDLAVRAPQRRRGVATALIRRLQEIGRERRVWAIYVQADYGDAPAVALYAKLGRREDVMHFDLET